jgi:SAM-dependent methyltransferase
VPDTYTHGHHESVLRSHRWRTAENSAGYLLPLLEPGMRLLDVGCGPGTITLDLAAHVAPGLTVGVDREAGVVAEAQSLLDSRPISGVEFRTSDAYALNFDDESFDVVHAHQVLQHLSSPVAALVEMRRVLRPGGVLAVRDSDYGGFVWAPALMTSGRAARHGRSRSRSRGIGGASCGQTEWSPHRWPSKRWSTASAAVMNWRRSPQPGGGGSSRTMDSSSLCMGN